MTISQNLTKVKSIETIDFKGKVYNFSVQDDESYCAEGIKVHNCRGVWVSVTAPEADTGLIPPAKPMPKSILNRFDLNAKGEPQTNMFKYTKMPILNKKSRAYETLIKDQIEIGNLTNKTRDKIIEKRAQGKI